MDCSEFLSRFSEFYDAPRGAPERKEAEDHMAACGKCARYHEVVSRSVALLHTMPKAELGESFRPRLEHRLFHLDEAGPAVRSGMGSAIPAVTVLGMAILLSAIAWSPTLGNLVPEVQLPAIVVSGPPISGPVLQLERLGVAPVSSDLFSGGLWSDPKTLLYEYSPMSERYRGQAGQDERVLRKTGLD
jgi:hypothetical protein